jgi:hypothetical protein
VYLQESLVEAMLFAMLFLSTICAPFEYLSSEACYFVRAVQFARLSNFMPARRDYHPI